MSRFDDELDPDLFTKEEWIRYTGYRTQALGLILLGVTLFVGGLASSSGSMSMQGADLATMEIQTGRFFGGPILAALGVTLAIFGKFFWEGAGLYRQHVERQWQTGQVREIVGGDA